jgi:hypothetical protein
MYRGKRGKLETNEPSALARLGVAAQRWEHDVKGVGSGCWRVVGTAQELIDKAITLGQPWVKGMGYARTLIAKADSAELPADTGAKGARACWPFRRSCGSLSAVH